MTALTEMTCSNEEWLQNSPDSNQECGKKGRESSGKGLGSLGKRNVISVNEPALSESLALSAVEWVERAVAAAPKSMKRVEALVLVRSTTRREERELDAIRGSRIASQDGFRDTPWSRSASEVRSRCVSTKTACLARAE